MLLTLMGHSMMAKPVEPEKAMQVAKNSLYLASDLSEYITGQVICVDGGLSL